MAASPAYAQSAPASTEVEEVVVTGSRIARREIDALQPTVVTSEQAIEDSGLTNLGNVVRESPLFQAYDQSTGDRASANSGDAGVTFANLYGLGSQRTLTLIDGKRVVGAASPNGGGSNGLQVDISAIPIGLVRRIETISVGGAPIYGSDAIAGTVNVILKDDFEGLEIEGQYGLTGEGDGGNARGQILYGRNFDEGRGNIALSAAWTKTDGVSAQDRDYDLPFGFVGSLTNSQLNIPITGGGFVFSSKNGRPSAFFGLGGLNPTTGAPTGFYTNGSGAPLTFDESGNLVAFDPGTPAGAVAAGMALVTYLPGDDDDTTRQMAGVISPSERTYFNGMGSYEFTPSVTGWTRFSYTQTEASFTGAAPLSSALGATALTYSQLYSTSNPFLTPSARSYFTANPTAFTGTSFYLNKEYTEVTDGRVDIDQETWTFQAGLRGDFELAGRAFDWDVTYSRGRTTRQNTADNILSARLGFAQDAVYANPTSTAVLATPANLDVANFTYDDAANVYRENGTGNLITCRVRVSGGPVGANPTDVSTCAPFNPFGKRNPQDALNYLIGQAMLRSEIEQQYVQGNVSGELFQLPAGPLQIAAGFEIRKEDASFSLDAATATGLFLGGGTGVPVSGGFETKEIYSEVRIPILNGDIVESALGFRAIEGLEFEGAVRAMDNSYAGKDTTWTAGGRLTLTPDIMIRGNKTRSVRQPAVAELFAGVEPRTQSITDPCAVGVIDSGPSPANRRANCIQAVIDAGLAANATAATTFLSTYTTPLGGITGTFAGNPSLRSEEADSWTVGLVLTPRFLPGFTATIDWVNIDIENAIVALDGGSVAANCYDASSLSSLYCSAITRGPTFRIVSFESFYGNISKREFAGLTISGRYAFDPARVLGRDEGSLGDLQVAATAFYLEHDRSGVAALTDNKGAVGYEEWRAQFSVDYTLGDLGVNWQTTWYDDAKIDPNSSAIFLYNDVDSYTLNDVAIRYQFTPAVKASFVINNVFDAEPPFNSFSYQYDRLGRRFMAGINLKF